MCRGSSSLHAAVQAAATHFTTRDGVQSPNWNEIALCMGNRNQAACRERYHTIAPDHEKGPWDAEGDAALRQAIDEVQQEMDEQRSRQVELGRKPPPQKGLWSKVAKRLGGVRSNHSCRQRWQKLQRCVPPCSWALCSVMHAHPLGCMECPCCEIAHSCKELCRLCWLQTLHARSGPATPAAVC